MANITLKELIEKLNKVASHYKIDPSKEVINDAWVADSRDREYPPGTILFECVERNAKIATPEDTHILSIYPDRITNLQ